MKLHTRHSESLPPRPASWFFPSRRRAALPFFQTKLKVGQAGDRFEQEADRVAEQVTAGGAAPPVQKMCAECAAEKEEEEPLRRQPAGGGGAGGAAAGLEERLAASRGGGEALPPSVESSMGAAFGRDFSGVRVHTDTPAVQLSRDLEAAAFTQGNHVYFGAGQFAPESAAGRRLIAHELTHVVQQGFAGPAAAPVQRQSVAELPVQRELLARNGNCSRMAGLPIDETASVARGAHFTETFVRPSSGKVRVTVRAEATGDCHPDNTFGVNFRQCHIVSDEDLDSQTVKRFGETISYDQPLPTEEWNTYAKFYVRIYVTCAASVQVRVEEIP